MNVCKYCTGIGGYHKRHCPVNVRTTPQPTPKPRTYRIEWFGTLQVHQPIRPTVHETAREFKVACA